MSQFPPKDKGEVHVPEWLSQVYANDVLYAIAAKKKETSKRSDEVNLDDLPKVCSVR